MLMSRDRARGKARNSKTRINWEGKKYMRKSHR
jgi:hypothetical protein